MTCGETPQGGRLSPELSVLVVTYFFPPDSEVGGKRMARFCRYLPEFGVRPVVLTVKQDYAGEIDNSFATPSGLQIERTPVLGTPLTWYAGWKRRLRPGGTPAGTEQARTAVAPRPGSLRRNVMALLQTPDKFWGWYRPAVRAGAELIKKESIDVILSSGPPWTSHLVARRLRKTYGVPWIADFRDAWVSDTWRQDLPRWRNSIDYRFEASCISRADLILCTTDALRESFLRNYPCLPSDKFAALTNGFDDPTILPKSDSSQVGKRVLLHLGDLYAGRRVDTFCQAVADLVDAGKIDSSCFSAVFMGNNDTEIEAAARLRTPELIRKKCIEFRSRVGWQEAQRALNSADVLLIFQGNHRLAVPAKTYEYLQTGKPILALVQKGALSDLLESTGSGLWADPEIRLRSLPGFCKPWHLRHARAKKWNSP